MAWTWVEKLQQRVREMTGVMKAADYESVLQVNGADHDGAQAKLKKARAELERQYVELEIAGDRVALQRLRKQVRDAQEAVNELAYARERLVAARDAAAAAEFAADVQARWAAAERIAERWKHQGEEIAATLTALAEQARTFLETGKELHDTIPELASDVKGSGTMLWTPGRLAREVDLQLWALSDGLLAPKSGAVGFSSPYLVRGGPDFNRRVYESVALAFKGRAQSATPEPPEAA